MKNDLIVDRLCKLCCQDKTGKEGGTQCPALEIARHLKGVYQRRRGGRCQGKDQDGQTGQGKDQGVWCGLGEMGLCEKDISFGHGHTRGRNVLTLVTCARGVVPVNSLLWDE